LSLPTSCAPEELPARAGPAAGRSVTFMPRWNEQADSQSIHLHISLKDKAGKPLF
jgi:glutamine synthetase